MMVGASDAYFTGRQIAWLLRNEAGLDVMDVPAYEYDSFSTLLGQDDVLICVSQSGETAGTLQAIERAKESSAAIVSILNVPGSSMAELSDVSLQRCSGAEVCVLGRADYHAVAQVAALNIKEASYVHAEAFSAGELKHGVLALITRDVPVLVYVGKGDVFMRQVIAEVQARGAWVIGLLADAVCQSICDESLQLPAASSALASLVPGQLLAYLMALALARNPDRPRNLAKSITVL